MDGGWRMGMGRGWERRTGGEEDGEENWRGGWKRMEDGRGGDYTVTGGGGGGDGWMD